MEFFFSPIREQTESLCSGGCFSAVMKLQFMRILFVVTVEECLVGGSGFTELL
jgi:hypothetical protein